MQKMCPEIQYRKGGFVLLLIKVKLLVDVVHVEPFFPTFVHLDSFLSPAAESITGYCGKLSCPHDANQEGSGSDNMS